MPSISSNSYRLWRSEVVIEIENRHEVVATSEQGRAILAKLFRALGDPNRLALLQFISQEERTATECVGFLELAQSRVSSHLACLVACGLAETRREGRFSYYRVTDARVGQLVGLGAGITLDHAASIAACLTVGPVVA